MLCLSTVNLLLASTKPVAVVSRTSTSIVSRPLHHAAFLDMVTHRIQLLHPSNSALLCAFYLAG